MTSLRGQASWANDITQGKATVQGTGVPPDQKCKQSGITIR